MMPELDDVSITAASTMYCLQPKGRQEQPLTVHRPGDNWLNSACRFRDPGPRRFADTA